MNKFTLYKINISEPIEIHVSTSPKIDGFVKALIRGKTNNNMIKYTLSKISNTEPILFWFQPPLNGFVNAFIRGKKK